MSVEHIFPTGYGHQPPFGNGHCPVILSNLAPESIQALEILVSKTEGATMAGIATELLDSHLHDLWKFGDIVDLEEVE